MATLDQKLFMVLSIKLQEKTKEYKKLCDEFEELKKQNLDPNSKVFETLKDKFLKNQNDILKIKKQLEKLNKK